MRHTITALLLLLPSAAFSQTAVKASDAQIAGVRASLEDRLADAESARLKDVVVITRPEGLQVVCGLVNAKNRYGAYVGYQAIFGVMGQDQAGRDAPHIMGVGRAAQIMCEKELAGDYDK